MAGMGISILTASGDQGTGKQGTFKCKKFDPTWPASSPWVTSVGGTYIESGSPEQGWSGSGGGFSAVFKRPAYQDARVKAYLGKAKLPPAGLFDAAGRATPDVSALATNYRVYSGGWGSISGTSAATPVFAGIISLINDRRIAQGKPTLGFLNTVLYGAAAGDSPVGSDIVTGDNKAPGCAAGFPAAVGYDAITGLGTPDFAVLTKLLQQ
jgi:tripeptidyl-peptidase-1